MYVVKNCNPNQNQTNFRLRLGIGAWFVVVASRTGLKGFKVPLIAAN
jgi:hypothetical protein